TIDEAVLLPLAERPVSEGRPLTGSLLDMLPEAIVIFDEKPAVLDAAEKFWQRLEVARARAGEDAPPPDTYYWNIDDWRARLDRVTEISLEELALDLSDRSFHLPTRPTTRFQGNMPHCMRELQSLTSSGWRAVFFGASAGEVERLADIFNEYGVAFQL